jgi:hypothetical protein
MKIAQILLLHPNSDGPDDPRLKQCCATILAVGYQIRGHASSPSSTSLSAVAHQAAVEPPRRSRPFGDPRPDPDTRLSTTRTGGHSEPIEVHHTSVEVGGDHWPRYRRIRGEGRTSARNLPAQTVRSPLEDGARAFPDRRRCSTATRGHRRYGRS